MVFHFWMLLSCLVGVCGLGHIQIQDDDITDFL